MESAAFEAPGLKEGWALLVLKWVDGVWGCWDTDATLSPARGLWFSVLRVVGGSFLRGGAWESLTSRPEDEVGHLRPPPYHVHLTVCRQVENVVTFCFTTCWILKPARKAFPANPPVFSLCLL